MFKISVEGNCLRDLVSIIQMPREDETGSGGFPEGTGARKVNPWAIFCF